MSTLANISRSMITSKVFEQYADEADGALNLALGNLMSLEDFCLKSIVPYLHHQYMAYNDEEARDAMIELNRLLEGFDE